MLNLVEIEKKTMNDTNEPEILEPTHFSARKLLSPRTQQLHLRFKAAHNRAVGRQIAAFEPAQWNSEYLNTCTDSWKK